MRMSREAQTRKHTHTYARASFHWFLFVFLFNALNTLCLVQEVRLIYMLVYTPVGRVVSHDSKPVIIELASELLNYAQTAWICVE